MKIFVTGCCGYIGSHTCVELLDQGYEIVGFDNFSNSRPDVLDNIYKIIGKHIDFYEGDLLNEDLLVQIFKNIRLILLLILLHISL